MYHYYSSILDRILSVSKDNESLVTTYNQLNNNTPIILIINFFQIQSYVNKTIIYYYLNYWICIIILRDTIDVM